MKKIMFNSKYGLDKAVLEGRKTMTRRIIPEKLIVEYYDYDDYCNSIGLDGIDMSVTRKFEKEFFLEHSPYKVGEVIAIAQSYKDCGYDMELIIDGKLMYKHPGWNNKMFVKPEMMKKFIKITGLKAECLMDISYSDIIAEGIQYNIDAMTNLPIFMFPNGEEEFLDDRTAFRTLIDKICGKGTWHSDPWVYAYEFELTSNPNNHESKEIDWEQRRYEIAKDALAGIISEESIPGTDPFHYIDKDVSRAIEYADELIKHLKSK
jgi:hypothetical protein